MKSHPWNYLIPENKLSFALKAVNGLKEIRVKYFITAKQLQKYHYYPLPYSMPVPNSK